MAGKLMVPAQPPLPTARNFPFQFSAGSQISISMCESGVGARTAAMRQWAGRATGCCPRPAVDGPAATSSAAVMVISGPASDLRLSHGVAAASVPTNMSAPIIEASWFSPLYTHGAARAER
jgi:hypothetical protein